MKISVQWIKDYVDIPVSVDILAQRLTMAGLEVEKIEKSGQDTVLEMEITPNRPDCLNMLGIAREISAIFNVPLKSPKMNQVSCPRKKCNIVIEDREGCAGYIGALVQDVIVRPVPQWISKRITALGLRPINNIVDITNFCLLETGQPLHAFDYDRLKGGCIIVRRAKKGEKIVTIDDVERELDPSILVIADAERPVAIAGVMGGRDTEVTDQTKNILLESAYFDPVLIRRASRKLGLSTDSSYRFERGVDKVMVDLGSLRALALILEIAEGKALQRSLTGSLKATKFKKRITISTDEINHYVGAKLKSIQCRTILKKLGFSVENVDKNVIKIQSPSFRDDIKGKPDIVEEITRIIGYDNIPSSVPAIIMSNTPEAPKLRKRQTLAHILRSQGLNEVITYTMINQDALMLAKQQDLEGQKIQNPLTKDQTMMRPTLLPSLCMILKNNINKGQRNIRFFEMGKIYRKREEQETLGLILTGAHSFDWRREEQLAMDYYDLKGFIENMLAAYRVPKTDVSFDSNDNGYLAEGQRATIFLKGKKIGVLGQVDEDVLINFDIKRLKVFYAELDLEALYNYDFGYVKFMPLPEYPSVQRDISLAVKKELSAQTIMQALDHLSRGIDSMRVSSIRFIEKYEGEKIADDQRGLVFSLQYQSPSTTLRDDDVSAVHQSICQQLVDRLGVTIR